MLCVTSKGEGNVQEASRGGGTAPDKARKGVQGDAVEMEVLPRQAGAGEDEAAVAGGQGEAGGRSRHNTEGRQMFAMQAGIGRGGRLRVL